MTQRKFGFSRRASRCLLLCVVALGLGAGISQAAASKAGEWSDPKVRMINPFFEGIAVQPPKIRYFDGTLNLPPTVSALAWQSWGGSTAVATGVDSKRKPIEVTLSQPKPCGLPGTLLYTRITVGAKTHQLQCQVGLMSGQDIGRITEDVSHYDAVGRPDYYFNIPVSRNRSLSFSESVWRNLGRPVTNARGVVDKWWGDPFDFRWVGARMTQSKIGYCPQFGALVYRRVKLTAYGPGLVIQPGDRVQRHSKALRAQVGKARPRHSASYDFSRWCKRKKYPEELWQEWR